MDVANRLWSQRSTAGPTPLQQRRIEQIKASGVDLLDPEVPQGRQYVVLDPSPVVIES